MKIRYKQTERGLVAIAKVYSQEEHNIGTDKIDEDAKSVIEKLSLNGYESFLVGGAVRDLLLGKTPKDFDVVTEASPRQVHKLFRNSRIIGKRFKIVHVVFGSKIIEVSTFRSLKEHDGNTDNLYGTVEEDAKRRDFSVNSLYYNPIDCTILDFNNAMNDFKLGRITSLIPLDKTFEEDPVRMIRALKCSVTTGFRLRIGIKLAIRRYSTTLIKVSNSRLTEELNKILAGGYSAKIFRLLYKYNLLIYLLPCISVYAKGKALYNSLNELDEFVKNQKKSGEEPSKPQQYFALAKPFIIVSEDKMTPFERFRDIFRQIKVLLSPNTPPNYELERAAVLFMKENNLQIPASVLKKKREDGQKEHNRAGYKKRKPKIQS